MTEPLLMLGLIATGLAAGWVGGALGIGGGVLIVPVLHLVVGLPIGTAVGTSLLVITATATAAGVGYLRESSVEMDWAVRLGVFALIGAIAASRLAAIVDPQLVAWSFATLLVVVAARMALPEPESHAAVERPALALATMPVAGSVAGLLGVGGGVVQVPVLRLLLGRDMRRSVATSTVMVGWTAAVASIAYLGRGEVDLGVVPWLLLGVLAGARVAPASTRRLGGRVLELGFALVLLWTAWRMVGG